MNLQQFDKVPTNYRTMKREVEFMKNNREFDKVAADVFTSAPHK